MARPILRLNAGISTPDLAPAVRELQDLLNARGAGIGADGKFGPGTDRAVRAFQRSTGLSDDGVVGEKTWAALVAPPPATPVPAAPPPGHAVVDAERLNLRASPSSSGPVLRELLRGADLDVIGSQSEWLRVRDEDGEGWVKARYVRVVSGETEAAEPGFLGADESLAGISLPPGRPLAAPSGATAQQKAVAGAWNRYGGLLGEVGRRAAVASSAAVAVLCVESAGQSHVDGNMIIRFENHKFWSFWGKANPDRFRTHFAYDADQPWKGHLFRESATAAWTSFHGSQSKEWAVLAFARRLDDEAARKAISMGLPQIMGFNHALVGYATVGAMFDRFQADARWQVLGLFDFVRGPNGTSDMALALQQRRWEDFARRYNGSGQAAEYGSRIASHVTAANALGLA